MERLCSLLAQLVRNEPPCSSETLKELVSLTAEAPSNCWPLLDATAWDDATTRQRLDTLKSVCSSLTGDKLQESGDGASTDSGHTINCQLTLDRITKTIPVRLADLWLVALPLALFIDAKQRACQPKRFVVGFAGSAAAGKTTFCALLQAILRSLDISCVVLGMDGYHMYNAKLEALGIRKDKGSPHTFEAELFASDLEKAKNEQTAVYFPIYDRQLHDPVADGLCITPTDRVLLVEGLFLLHEAQHWELVAPQLDFAVFLAIPLDIAAEHATQRKARTNNISIEAATAHVNRVDIPNFRVIDATRSRADMVLHRDAAHQFVSAELHKRR
eukprot:m.136784 g.136784  ORF g.136784 m.136784 type:complete len:330 (-) comp16589_c1_seq1:2625-3614(-)